MRVYVILGEERRRRIFLSLSLALSSTDPYVSLPHGEKQANRFSLAKNITIFFSPFGVGGRGERKRALRYAMTSSDSGMNRSR